VECIDGDGGTVAIKIVRAVKRYGDSAAIEARILQDVNGKVDPRGKSLCVQLLSSFTFQDHFCLVFETLGDSLYDVLKAQDYKPFEPEKVRRYTEQLLDAVDFLHGFKLIHTDLKLENILLCGVGGGSGGGGGGGNIKLIDFGGATYDDRHKSKLINTRQYRAPEVILGVGWSMPSDVWSVGCIVAELASGELLFSTHDNLEHLGLIEKRVGAFPESMIRGSKLAEEEMVFDKLGQFRGELLGRKERGYVKKTKELGDEFSGEGGELVSLMRQLLIVDPRLRVSARQALDHLREEK
jgi:dual-specificity kinase/CDC-like kinase